MANKQPMMTIPSSARSWGDHDLHEVEVRTNIMVRVRIKRQGETNIFGPTFFGQPTYAWCTYISIGRVVALLDSCNHSIVGIGI